MMDNEANAFYVYYVEPCLRLALDYRQMFEVPWNIIGYNIAQGFDDLVNKQHNNLNQEVHGYIERLRSLVRNALWEARKSNHDVPEGRIHYMEHQIQSLDARIVDRVCVNPLPGEYKRNNDIVTSLWYFCAFNDFNESQTPRRAYVAPYSVTPSLIRNIDQTPLQQFKQRCNNSPGCKAETVMNYDIMNMGQNNNDVKYNTQQQDLQGLGVLDTGSFLDGVIFPNVNEYGGDDFVQLGRGRSSSIESRNSFSETLDHDIDDVPAPPPPTENSPKNMPSDYINHFENSLDITVSTVVFKPTKALNALVGLDTSTKHEELKLIDQEVANAKMFGF